MTWVACFAKYLQANLVMAVAAPVALGFAAWNSTHRGLSFRRELHVHYLFMAWCLAVLAWSSFLPKSYLWTPQARVWAAESAREWASVRPGTSPASLVLSVNESGSWKAPAETPFFVVAFFAALFGLALAVIVRDTFRLFWLRQNSILLRRIGRVSVVAVEKGGSPFSFSSLLGAWVVIPEAVLSDPSLLKPALLHELEHLRQRDTVAVYALALLRSIFLFNPLFALWQRCLLELQEFACDEALVLRARVSSQAMGGCLLRVAELSVPEIDVPYCAAGMCFSGRSSLKRRILTMTKKTGNQTVRWKAGFALWVVTALTFGALTAMGSSQLVQDRRITLDEALTLKRSADSDFPLAINEHVVRELNVYVGTPDGRKFIRESLARLRALQNTVVEKMESYSAPLDLLAVPVVESGFQNLTQEGNPVKGAGLWQFIPSTARNYGLLVNDQIDERLDILLETDAAMRYLFSNRLRFKSWELALMAYNSGEGTVQGAIDKFKTRDAWELAKKAADLAPRYLAKVTAVALILKNPQLLD